MKSWWMKKLFFFQCRDAWYKWLYWLGQVFWFRPSVLDLLWRYSFFCLNYTICVHDDICNNILQLTFPFDWSWKTSLLLGGLLSATDPVAVVALLKELGAGKKLSTIIEGESLMNDGYQDSTFFYFSFLTNSVCITCYSEWVTRNHVFL